MSNVEYYFSYSPLESRTRKRAFTPKAKVLNGEELLKLLQDANETLTEVSTRLRSYSNNADMYFSQGRENIVISKTGWPHYFTILEAYDESNFTKLSDTLAFLASLEAKNTHVINMVTDGQPIINNQIYLKHPIVGQPIVRRSAFNLGTIYSVNLIDGVKCGKCSAIMDRNDMKSHELHPECIIEEDRARMKNLGYVQVKNIDDVIAVRAAAVEHEKVSEFWAFWVPPWINEAINTYHRSNNEFAGMTLEEFLRAMKPEGQND